MRNGNRKRIVLGFLSGSLTLLLLLGLTGYVVGRHLWASGKQTPSWTLVPPTPTTVVTPLPPSQPTPTPSGQFSIGEKIRVVAQSRVRLRRTAGFRDKPAGDILASMQPDSVLIVLGGPKNVDGLTWWKVDYEGLTGWVAESTSSGVRLLGK